ncbi:MAG: hypothetical protein QW540_09195 [Archaeoglobaceae archaeon]
MIGAEISEIVSIFKTLQPVEQKLILDLLLHEFQGTPFECTFCGSKTVDVLWLANLPLCRSCYGYLKGGGNGHRTLL